MSNTVFENKDINASVSGENTTYFFSKEKITIGLTDNFIYKEISKGVQNSTIIYPHSRIDSYGVEVSEKKLWLILGGVFILSGLFVLIDGSESGFTSLVLGGIFILLWWISRKLSFVVNTISKQKLEIELKTSNTSNVNEFIKLLNSKFKTN